MAKKLTSTKAKKILHDKSVHGHPLTDKQRKFFGAIAGGAEPYQAQLGTMLAPITSSDVANFFEMLSAPQKAITKLITGKYQTPAEAMNVKNPVGAFAIDAALDPLSLITAGPATKVAKVAGRSAGKAAKNVAKKVDRAIYPTRTYRVEAPGGNQLSYKPSELSKKVYEKGDWTTSSLEGLEFYARNRGLLEGKDVILTEYKVPFWKKNIKFDEDVVALKESQGTSKFEMSADEFIIPRNKFLYPRRTTTIKAVPKHLFEDPLYIESMRPASFESQFYGTQPIKYIEDQINAVTGHRMPLSIDYNPYKWDQYAPMSTWKQPQFAPAEGVGKFERFQEGGWLDKYDDIPQAQNGIEGTMGGLTDKGFNYNGAWGGPSMQDGGNLIFLEPTSRKLPMGYVIPYNTPSTELATSIGGEGDEPAYLIPSFKYGRLLEDPKAEFRRTGEHLGGPFKTWQEADEWERTVRHPYVEKGQNIPTPLKRWGKDFAMGGSMPGAVGFTYARTAGAAPANGPYAKKTKASAQNGEDVKSSGLDWLKTWVSHPEFKTRLSNLGRNPETEQTSMIDTLSKYQPKSYKDLLREKGLGQWLSLVKNTGGVSFGEPGSIYVKREKEKTEPIESVRAHELTHLLDLNNNWFTDQDKEALKKPFLKNQRSYSKSFREGLQYFTDPTEIHARMNQARQYFNMTPDQEFTPEMYEEIKKKTKWFGLQPYIQDKQALIELMNKFVYNEPVEQVPVAQNGMEMKYYQEGLDFKPKTISKNGGWLDKYDEAQTGKILPKWQERLQEETSKLDSPLSTLNLSKKGYTKDEIKTIQKAAQKEQPVVKSARPDYRTTKEKEREAFEREQQEGQRKSPLTQTLSSFTPSGYNPEAGLIGAQSTAQQITAFPQSATNVTRFFTGRNPYGEETFDKGLGLAGDLLTIATGAYAASPSKGSKVVPVVRSAAKNKAAAKTSQELSILPRGNYLENELIANKNITWNDIDKVAKKQMDWLQSNEYFKRRSAATGESTADIQKDVDKMLENWKNIKVNVEKASGNTLGYYSGDRNKIGLASKLSRAEALQTLDHEVKHALSQMGGIGGNKGYKNYPTTDVGNWLTKIIRPKETSYYADAAEQQVRALRLMDFIEETQGVPKGTQLSMKNIDRFAKDIAPKSGPFAKKFWEDYSDVGSQLIKMDEADKRLKFIPGNLKQRKFPFEFVDQGKLRQSILDQLNKAYVVPGAIGLGAAALGSSEEVPQQQDGGNIPVDPMGYWNPENVGGPVIIPSNEITMEGVDQPLIGISDTGDVQYMEPGENYEFDGEYVTEIPIAQRGKTLPEVKVSKEPIYTSDPKDPRLKAYRDSLNLYNSNVADRNKIFKTYSWLKPGPILSESEVKKVIDEKNKSQAFREGPSGRMNYGRFSFDQGMFEKQKKFDEYKKDKIKNRPVGWQAELRRGEEYTKGNLYDYYPVYKKPVQPVVYKKPEPKKEVEQPRVTTEKVNVAPAPPPTPPYRMQGSSPAYGPTSGLLGKYDEFSKKFYPNYTKEGFGVESTKADEELLDNPEKLKSFLRSRYQLPKDFEIVPKQRRGGSVNKADEYPIEKLDQSLNFTNYNKPTKGGWLDKYK